MLSNKRHFAYNLLTSYGNTVISSILAFVSVPIALSYWGSELYGIWTILTSFATYITASGLGIDSATGLLMTKNTDFKIKISILHKGIKLLLITTLIAACIITVLTIIVPDWFKIIGKMDDSNYPIAKISALIFVAGILINLPLSAVSNSLQAVGKAYVCTLINTLQTILSFLVILIIVTIKLSLPFYVFLVQSVTVLCSLIKLLIVLIIIKKQKNNIENTCITDSEDNHYKAILKMGMNMSLSGLALLLIPNFSNLIISNNIDVKSLVPYSLSYKLFSTILLFVSNMNVALAPLLGSEYGKKNWDWLIRTYKRMFYSSTTLAVFCVLGVIWFSKPFVKLWTGSFENYAGNLISIVLGLYFLIAVFSNINHVIINAFNYTNKVWLVSWADGMIFLLSSQIMIKSIGVISVPLGLCAGGLLISSWAYPFLVYRRTEKKFKYDFKYLHKLLLVFLVSIFLFFIISNLRLSFVLITIMEIFGMIITTLLLFLILPNELKKTVITKIKKI